MRRVQVTSCLLVQIKVLGMSFLVQQLFIGQSGQYMPVLGGGRGGDLNYTV